MTSAQLFEHMMDELIKARAELKVLEKRRVWWTDADSLSARALRRKIRNIVRDVHNHPQYPKQPPLFD